MINFHAVFHVWRRNFMVWRKLALPSLLGNVVDPVMALMAFGLGLGSMLPDVGGMPYLNYLAVGAVCISAMNAPTFEALYSAFSRMHTQKTWQVIMNTPVRLREVVLGECTWAASKGLISTGAMLLIVALLGIGDLQFWVLSWLVLILACLMFAGFGLCINARAPSYDFFMFYFTLVVTPMTFLSGVFYSIHSLPAFWQGLSHLNPFFYMIDGFRYGFFGQSDVSPWVSLAVVSVALLGVGTLAIQLLKTGYKIRG